MAIAYSRRLLSIPVRFPKNAQSACAMAAANPAGSRSGKESYDAF
jgi:uncharacterized membrane protein